MNSTDSLPSGWTWSTLADVTADKIDRRGPSSDDPFVYIEIGSIDNQQKRILNPRLVESEVTPSRARQRVECDDVLVSLTRPNLNAVAMVPRNMHNAIASTGLHVLRATSAIPGWLHYLVQTSEFVDTMSKSVQGALYPAIRSKDVRAFSFPLPPIPEQRQMELELDRQVSRIDVGIRALSRAALNVNRYRRAIWTAACDGRLMSTTIRRKSATLAQKERHPRHSTTASAPAEPRDVPNDWSWSTVDQVAIQVQYGTSHRADRAIGVPILRMPNIQNGQLTLGDLKYLPQDHLEFPALLLESGDVLFNRTNSLELVGKTAVYGGTPEPCSFASYLIRVRLSKDCVPEFLAYYLNSDHGRSWAKKVATQQVGQANISGTRLKALAIPIPPIAEQNRIVVETEHRLAIVAELSVRIEASLRRGSMLRQAIIDRTLHGFVTTEIEHVESATSSVPARDVATHQRSPAHKESPPPLRLDTHRNQTERSLQQVLESSNAGLTPEALFGASGYTADSVGQFYSDLKQAIGEGLIEETRQPDGRRVLVWRGAE